MSVGASWAYPQLPAASNPLQNGQRAAAQFGYPFVVKNDMNTQPFYGVPTSHRELEDTLHGPWARGKSRVLFYEAVVQNLIGMDQRGVFKVYPPKETDSVEVVITRTEYDAFEAAIAPEHQPVKLVAAKGGTWTVRTERFGIGFKCGRLWGRQPGSKQEIQYGINQGKDAFINRAEMLIHQEFLARPTLLQQQFIMRNRGGNRMSPVEMANMDAAFFGALVRLETPVADMMQEAMHNLARPDDELDTLILPRGSVQFLQRRMFALSKASDVGDEAYRAKFQLNGNVELVIGRNKVYDSRRCDVLRAHFPHTEPLAELAATGTYWTFTPTADDSKDAVTRAAAGIWVHDNKTDRLVHISLATMLRNAVRHGFRIGDTQFLILRPNDRRFMGSAILTRQGGDVGFTNICHEGIEVSHSGETEFSKFSMRMHIGPVTTRPELIMRIANVSYVPGGYVQGGGVAIFNAADGSAYHSLYAASHDDPSARDIVIFGFDDTVRLPDSHFYPNEKWGAGGDPTGLDEHITRAIRDVFNVNAGEMLLDRDQIFDPPSQTREEGGYFVTQSPGFCVEVHTGARGPEKIVKFGSGREGRASIPGSRAAREMRMSDAVPFISNATTPKEVDIIPYAR